MGIIQEVFNTIINAINNRQHKNEKGKANGYAGLDSSGKVPANQLPESSGGAGVSKSTLLFYGGM